VYLSGLAGTHHPTEVDRYLHCVVAELGGRQQLTAIGSFRAGSMRRQSLEITLEQLMENAHLVTTR
jgi:hypothetical protein